MENNSKIKIGFFGTPELSVITLNELKNAGYTISFVVTVPDRPQGRKMLMTPSPVKVWAIENKIKVLQPEKLRSEDFVNELKSLEADVYVVMAYGKIIPDEILNIPKYKSLNIHPSLLPKYRGSCPIETAILNDDKNTGVTIIRMDKEMDHGPIVAIKEIALDKWPIDSDALGKTLVMAGLNILVNILPKWIKGKIEEIEQDHGKATFTKKITKEDGLIDLNDNPYTNFLKINAYHGWPSAYFFIDKDGKKIRVKITKASFVDNNLIIEKVIPEGKGEIDYINL